MGFSDAFAGMLKGIQQLQPSLSKTEAVDIGRHYGGPQFRQWTYFSGDLDDLFAYTTLKETVIRDRRLGIMARVGQVGVRLWMSRFLYT